MATIVKGARGEVDLNVMSEPSYWKNFNFSKDEAKIFTGFAEKIRKLKESNKEVPEISKDLEAQGYVAFSKELKKFNNLPDHEDYAFRKFARTVIKVLDRSKTNNSVKDLLGASLIGLYQEFIEKGKTLAEKSGPEIERRSLTSNKTMQEDARIYSLVEDQVSRFKDSAKGIIIRNNIINKIENLSEDLKNQGYTAFSKELKTMIIRNNIINKIENLTIDGANETKEGTAISDDLTALERIYGMKVTYIHPGDESGSLITHRGKAAAEDVAQNETKEMGAYTLSDMIKNLYETLVLDNNKKNNAANYAMSIGEGHNKISFAMVHLDDVSGGRQGYGTVMIEGDGSEKLAESIAGVDTIYVNKEGRLRELYYTDEKGTGCWIEGKAKDDLMEKNAKVTPRISITMQTAKMVGIEGNINIGPYQISTEKRKMEGIEDTAYILSVYK